MTTPACIPAPTPAPVITTWTVTIYTAGRRSVYRVQRLAPPHHQEEDEHADH